MKKMLVVGIMLILSFGSIAQSSMLADKRLVWAGIDFSEARLIGPEGFNDPDQIKDHYFNEWNNLILKESDKYNVQKFYRKDRVANDLSVVEERNQLPNMDEVIISSAYSFGEDKLQEIISNYNLEGHEDGLGLVYVVESLNKTQEKAFIHVVFFDIASKEILWTKKYTEPAGGFGFRNYWAKPIFLTMEKSGKEYSKFVKKM